MSNRYGPRIVTDGLVLCLDAADSNSYPGTGTTWTDLSGNGNNGTLNNGPTYSSSNKGYIGFDGTNDYIACQHSSSLNLDYCTISVWIFPTATKAAEILMKSLSINTSIPYGLQMWSDGKFYVHVRTSVSWKEIDAGSYSANRWYNLVSSYDGTTLKSYVNGLNTNSSSHSGTISNNTSILNISAINGYVGNMSQVNLYNRGLSDNEILQNYNATKGRFNL